MTYEEAENFIKNKESLGVKPGLERIKGALEMLGNPQDFYKTVHIAGTNGKGTAAASIASSLSAAGYKTGLFTSPWVVDYREQIQIDGKFISERELADQLGLIEKINIPCTEFECLCAAAFNYFKENKVDYAVVECGMGARGDATNVERKNLSVITSISLDHTSFLGKTVDEIAEEKSGILRKDCVCVLYDEELKSHFENKCKRLVTGGVNDNLSLVNAALCELGVKKRSSLVSLPARKEKIGHILLDGSHNVSAARMLAPSLKDETAVVAMMKDKDIDGYLKIIAPLCKRIIATQIDSSRCADAEYIAKCAKKYCNDVEIVKNPRDAVRQKGVTLVCGSFYLAREVRNLLLDL